MKEEELIKAVKKYVRDNDLATPLRRRDKVYPRFYLFKYLRKNTSLTLTEIGDIFQRDHSTVHRNIEEFDILKDDEDFYLKCYDVHKNFPMKFTSVWNISVGTLDLPPRLWKRINRIKSDKGYITYKETIEKILIQKA